LSLFLPGDEDRTQGSDLSGSPASERRVGSAVEAAMGLAHRPGNKVTLSYRKEGFSRIKERNSQRIAECIRKGKVQVLFDSVPAEFNRMPSLLK